LSSAFRNFFITFIVSLLVFGFVGWKIVYPALASITQSDISDIESDDTSDTESNDNSGDESEDVVVDGKTMTAFMVGRAADGLAASIIYFRINEGARSFTYCYIPAETKVGNDVGEDVPLKYLLPRLEGERILSKASALTGMDVEFYTVLGMEELKAIVEQMNDPYIDISREIRYLDPEFEEEYEGVPGSEIPEECYIVIPQGRNMLDGELVENLMNYNPNPDKSEYHVMTKQLYETVFTQFFTNSGTKNSTAPYKLWNHVRNVTNVSLADIDEYIDILFTYDTYQLRQITYPNDWSRAVTMFKDAG